MSEVYDFLRAFNLPVFILRIIFTTVARRRRVQVFMMKMIIYQQLQSLRSTFANATSGETRLRETLHQVRPAFAKRYGG
jgi:ribosomal protein L17